MRILICGGRDFTSLDMIDTALDRITTYHGKKIKLLISGGAQGADACAELLADQLGIPIMIFPPAWGKLGKAAGPVRNGWMLEFGQPDIVLAAPGGKGTADMIRQAKKANVPVVEIKQEKKATITE